jgi:hypothetical protein
LFVLPEHLLKEQLVDCLASDVGFRTHQEIADGCKHERLYLVVVQFKALLDLRQDSLVDSNVVNVRVLAEVFDCRCDGLQKL